VKPIVAIVAQGTMGTGLARRLSEHGVTVLTDVAGRSEASHARARAAGMTSVNREELTRAEIVMSVMPPALALPFAADLAPLLKRAPRKHLFVDCNAVNPATVLSIAQVIEPTGAAFVDVGIIGLPPRDGGPQPRLYAAGAAADQLAVLNAYGLHVRVIAGPVGTASALKMSYAGITKGLIFVSSAMLLAAARAGVAAPLAAELSESEPQLLASLTRRIPDMLPKAYRWVAEMEQISGFAAADPSAAALYQAAARFYERIAADVLTGGAETSAFNEFFRAPAPVES
jgi:3-hydroxyisobutyrate dehydrogenase-like beta-hydroxyacid dehydrogenase